MLRTALLLLALATPAAAQGEAARTRPDAKARVARLLAKLAGLDAFRFEAATSDPSAAPRAAPAATIAGTVEGRTTCWTRGPGQVLATRGGRWIHRGRDGDWIPSRRPAGPWRTAFLPDPRFLAGRLLALLPQTTWEVRSEITDDRVQRVYVAGLGRKVLDHLLESGALTTAGAGSAGNRVVFFARGGGLAPQAAVDGRAVIRLYDDPKTGLPVRIVADLFLPNAGLGGQVLVAGGGVLRARLRIAGRKQEPEEEEGEEAKQKKPNLRLDLTIHDPGTARARTLDEAGRKMLAGDRRPAAAGEGK